MNHPFRFILFTLLLVSIGVTGYSQKTTRGIVIDSISLKSLPGIHVRIKNKPGGTTTNAQGIFILPTSVTDTLVLSFVGYYTVEIPLFFEEEDILVRMAEKVRMLNEVTITSNRILPSVIYRTTRTLPKSTFSKDQAFSSPIDYFSKWQKEKRKLTKFINENDRIRTYVDVINDQALRESIMDEHELSEGEYYRLLAKFNEQNRVLSYSTNPVEIADALEAFFRKNVK
ncbi:MAG TPA: carboxypeptidase-like regulatory domain-containing protein [Chryseolinea sp.]|nr:carboxypeptidase-like regulatory domain-containing protein [Chryseolinea sp.]HPM29108.1 carboxypeptidase-like regulatory domain-containing protein [Chryseolinea sp.]